MVINTTMVRFRISSICKAYMSFWSLHIPVGFICMNIASKHKFHAYGLPRNSTAQLAVVNEFHSTSTKVQRTVGFWRNGLRQRFLMAGSVLCVCVCVFCVCVCCVCVCLCVCVCGVCLCVCVCGVCVFGRCCVHSWAVNFLLFHAQFVFSASAAGWHVAGTIYHTVPLAAAKCKDLICLRAFFTADVTRPLDCQLSK